MNEAKDQARVRETAITAALYNAATDYAAYVTSNRRDYDEAMKLTDALEAAAVAYAELAGDREQEAAPNSEAIASSLKRAGSGAPDCDVELAIALSRYVHDNCTNVPHDIGIHLAHIVDEYQKRRPVLPNDQAMRPDTTI